MSGLGPLSGALDDFMTPFRLILSLMTWFGATALGLAALGLYSVIARGVSRRTREFGIGMAMGAGRREIVSMVVREGLRSAAVGIPVGLLLGVGVARVLPSEILGWAAPPWHYLGAVLCSARGRRRRVCRARAPRRRRGPGDGPSLRVTRATRHEPLHRLASPIGSITRGPNTRIAAVDSKLATPSGTECSMSPGRRPTLRPRMSTATTRSSSIQAS